MARRLILAGLLALAASPAAQAHPHAWIDMTTRIAVDGQGRATGLHVDWLFDELYSLFALSEFGDDQAATDALAAATIQNLAAYDHFTRVHAGDERLRTGAVVDYSSVMVDGRWRLRFHLPFVRPVRLAGEGLRYAIYDPACYVEIRHRGEKAVSLDVGAEGCAVEITLPDPPAGLVALAAALDRGARSEEPIGAAFAEQVAARCG